MIRIAFVDVDGVVLIPGQSSPSPEAIVCLKSLRADGYRLVLHSSWRHGMMAEADHLFAMVGVPMDACVDCDEPCKATAIMRWLLDEYAGEWPGDVLILDDDIVSVPNTRHVRPDFRRGLVASDLPAAMPDYINGHSPERCRELTKEKM